jgi:uncharacterized lipoprotein
MKWMMALVSVLIIAGCSDVVTDRYQTLQAARDDQLFERGWLPDILPPSAHDIRTSNDLDLNTSEGEFYISELEFDAFVSRLQPQNEASIVFGDLLARIRDLNAKGYDGGEYHGR